MDQIKSIKELLPLCAVLRVFDAALLQSISGCDDAAIARLLASEYVTAAPAPPHAWQLRPELRQEILTQLRSADPNAELALHLRAFHAFLPLEAPSPNPVGWHERDEEATFHHLERIYYLLYQKQEWQRIQELVTRARQAAPCQLSHRLRLDLYEAYILLHTTHHSAASPIFHSLLAEETLESYTRLRALNGLAVAAMFQTQHGLALRWLQRVQEAAHEASDRMYQGVALLNQSIVYMDLHYFQDALDRASSALTLYQTLGHGALQLYSRLLCGKALLQLGHWQEAVTHLQAAEILAENLQLRAFGRNVYWAQGLLHHMTGDLAQSESFYRRALDIARSDDAGDQRIESDTLWYLGFLYHSQRRDEEAFTAYHQALTLAESLDRPHWQSLITYRRGDLLQRQGHLAVARSAYEQAIQLVEGLRGDSEAEQVKLGLLDTTQQLYEAMVLLCVERGETEAALLYVERARSQAFLDQLRRKEPALYDALDQPVVTLDELQATLPEGTLLLEFFTTGVIPRGENLINKLPPSNHALREYLVQPPRLLLFAITRDAFHFHALPLDPNRLQPPAGAQSPVRRLLRPRQLSHLYAQLLAPVEALLAAHEMLYLIPHGPLHHVPWMALKRADGRHLLHEDGPAIALAPSATILLRNCFSHAPAPAGSLLALGYDGDEEERLRYAEMEATVLAHLVGGEVWAGEMPKLARLATQGQAARWLHFSGHARFRPRHPLDSQLWLAPKERPTALELMRQLQLSADVVTLSACTSGLSQIAAGDELLGLPRAFLYAGSPTVVCTPWEAADLVALLVMERFYDALRRGSPPAYALRDAQVAVRRMTGRDLQATWARWRHDFPEATQALPPPDIPDFDSLPFADPAHWALFTVVGRGA